MTTKDVAQGAQKKIRNVLLENGKAIPVIQWQRAHFTELGPNIAWETELASDGLGYLAEEISKPSTENAAWFLLAVHAKIVEERDKLRKESLSKKDPGLDDLGNSQIVRIA